MGWLLATLGYVANQAQTSESNQGIVLLMSLIPAVFAALAVLLIRFYSLTDKKLEQIQSDNDAYLRNKMAIDSGVSNG